MKGRIKYLWLQVFALLFMLSVAHAQAPEQVQPAQAAAQSNFSQDELDQMLAPIALYPDALLSQMMMAATYPNEVLEAARWSRAHPGYKGESAVKAVEGQPWDISVKSLLPFPNVLSTMSTKIDWTERVGQAFLGQQQQVMDTIQKLRQKAMAAGYLKSDERVRVVTQEQLVVIEPVTPTAIYVPYYNPMVVYGTWWAPAYAPVYWSPWPGYAVVPGYYGWAWSPVATVVTVGLLFAAFDWNRRYAYYGRVDYWGRHPHRHYLLGRTGTSTRWTRDSTRPYTRVSGTRTGARTGTRTGVRTTTTRTGARTTTTRTGARTTTTRSGTRTTTTGTRTATGTRTGTRSTTVRPTTARTGTAPGMRSGGAVRSGGAATKGGAVHKPGSH